jgi:hypothetical protein
MSVRHDPAGAATASWRVHSEWLGGDAFALAERDQAAAEQSALQLACCKGARYISVSGPAEVVTFEWDRYTNVARRYGRYLGPCADETEPDGVVCPGELYALPRHVQVRCPTCGGWVGVRSPGCLPM